MHATQAQKEVTELKDQLRDFQLLKRIAIDITRMIKETRDLSREIDGLENELSASGSTRTSDDVQTELNGLGAKLQVAPRRR